MESGVKELRVEETLHRGVLNSATHKLHTLL